MTLMSTSPLTTLMNWRLSIRVTRGRPHSRLVATGSGAALQMSFPDYKRGSKGHQQVTFVDRMLQYPGC